LPLSTGLYPGTHISEEKMKRKFLNILVLKVNLLSVFTLIIFLSIPFISCNTTEPPPQENKGSAELSLADVSCTEVWINLGTSNISLPVNVELYKNDVLNQTIKLTAADTILYVDSLLPNQTYNFHSVIQPNSQSTVTSDQLPITTLDTTSSNFTFETYEFENYYSSSYFNDVWVFDRNNIWAVGDVSDSLGENNIMQWNGNSWVGRGFFNSNGIDGIWALDSSNIYFATGYIIKYDNGKFTEFDLGGLGFTNGQRVQRLWGSSESNIWGIGPWGTIVHFDGSHWSKIDFDTQWYFDNISGNPKTGIAYAVAKSIDNDGIVVKLQNSSASIIYQKSKSNLILDSHTICELNGLLYFQSNTSKIWQMNESTGKIKILFQLPGTLSISQSYAYAVNDIYFVGSESFIGKLVHFNGISFTTVDLPKASDAAGSIHAINNLAVSVGFSNDKAYLTKIIRR